MTVLQDNIKSINQRIRIAHIKKAYKLKIMIIPKIASGNTLLYYCTLVFTSLTFVRFMSFYS